MRQAREINKNVRLSVLTDGEDTSLTVSAYRDRISEEMDLFEQIVLIILNISRKSGDI